MPADAHLADMTQLMIPGSDQRTAASRVPAHPLVGYAAAAISVAVSTLLGLGLAERWSDDPVVLLYIPAVLAVAVGWGLWPAMAAAIGATLAYNYYFTEPYHTLVISNSADVVTVVVLFIVAVVTSQLAGMLRAQARLAADHAARNATIAGFARQLLSCTDETAIAVVTANELANLFDCQIVLATGGTEPCLLASHPANAELAPSDLAAAAVTLTTGEPTGRGVRKLDLADWQFRPIASAHEVLAAVGLARDDGVPPVGASHQILLESLLDQVALALVRARLESEARANAALRERDGLREMLLGSIGEDVKPRLNAIGAAARALKREGAGDKALVASLASEVVRLDRYVDNLVDLGPGADREPLRFGSLAIDLHRRLVARDGEAVHLTPKEYAVLAELAKHAGRVLSHAHLLRAVWGPAQADQIDYLRVAIRSLRQKIEADPAHPALILNEPAVGYRLAVP